MSILSPGFNILKSHGVIMDWIKCSEMMPEEKEEILFFVDRRIELGQYYDGNFNVFDPGYGIPYKEENVTHWMPLPKPPEDE